MMIMCGVTIMDVLTNDDDVNSVVDGGYDVNVDDDEHEIIELVQRHAGFGTCGRYNYLHCPSL